MTNADLHASTTVVRAEIAGLQADLFAEVGRLEMKVNGVRSAVIECRGELGAEVRRLNRWAPAVLVANALAVIAVVIL